MPVHEEMQISSYPTLNRQALISPFAGELAPSSQRVYAHDAEVFARWLTSLGIGIEDITEEVMTVYRGYLLQNYARATARRMFSVSCRLLGVQVGRNILTHNPAANVRGITAEDESPHIALSKEQAAALLESIPQETALGKRDYAMIVTLLYTGMRRFELAALTIGDMQTDQGYPILVIAHGKGDYRSTVRLRTEAKEAIEAYLRASGREQMGKDASLFCQFTKGGHPREMGISPNVPYRMVRKYAKIARIDGLTTHGMRASAATFMFEGGAKLEEVQWVLRHRNPATTLVYHKRRDRLVNSAVTKIQL